MDVLRTFFSSGEFMPHGYCYMWKPGLVWLHAISDSMIAIAYLFIPITLVYFVRKRRDIPFDWMFVCFGVFILACGATHALEVWTLWHATYWLSGAVKALTALVSVPTAFLLVRLIPRALALPSPEALRHEIAERERTQAALRQAKDELEMRVEKRTAELRKTNEGLLAEVARRVKTEEALGASEERFRLMVESVKDYSIFILDTTGQVISWNEGAERIKGYRAEEIIGHHFSCFYPKVDVEQGKPEIALQVAAAQGRFEAEGWRVRKDGSRFWASAVITAMRDTQGKLVGFSKITRDLSEWRRAEEALQATRVELTHASRAMTLGVMTGSIAHEINQPLAAIVSNANACRHLLAEPIPDLDEVREAISDIAESGTRAGQVIARIRALIMKAPPERTQLDINEVIEEVLALMHGELQRHDISVTTELSPHLPPVRGDRVQLQQVLLNLILNGIEAMGTVNDRPRVLTVSCRTDDSGGVLVRVEDSGVGFGRKNTAEIFKTFFTTKPKGMGMGLSISRSIIEAHGGRLWAESKDSPGAAFQFALAAAS